MPYETPKEVKKKLLRNLSIDKTSLATYEKRIKDFLNTFLKITGINIEKAKVSDFNVYINYFFKKGYSIEWLKLEREIIQYWYKDKFKKEILISLPKIKKRISSIKFLSNKELNDIFIEAEKNSFNLSLLLKLIYSSGLRLDEALNLKINDINLEKKRLHISGKYPRKTILSKSLINDLNIQINKLDENEFLFFFLNKNGEKRIGPISSRTIEIHFKKICAKLKLHDVTIKTLRDNFALHLLLHGVDKHHLSPLMGFRNNQSIIRLKSIIDSNKLKLFSPLDFPLDLFS